MKILTLAFAVVLGSAPLGLVAAAHTGETQRVVFLGDSITHAGGYAAGVECWLLSRGQRPMVLNIGLPSESAAELTAAERVEMMDLLVRCQAVLQKVMNQGGFNMGLNLGKAAGAGIPTHLHFHIVPRWDGDHDFMPVIADTRVLPQALAELWARLKPAFAAA